MAKVLIVDPIHAQGHQILHDAGFTVVSAEKKDEAGIIAAAADVWGIIVRTSKITRNVIDQAKELKIIGRHGAGVDNIDVKYATEQGIVVVNTPDANTLSVVEYVTGAILALAKGFYYCDRQVKKGEWSFREKFKPVEIHGKTLGIVGFGKIGREVAKNALSLGMKVLALDPFISPSAGYENILFCDSLDQILTNSDFVTLHVPLTGDSAGLMNLENIRKMKKTAFLINASRGEVVNENDLSQALSGGVIAGAVVDVYNPEPPAAGHPFFQLENMILTPHNAALTEEAMVRAATTVALDLTEYYRGEKPRHLVNSEVLSK